MKLETIYMLQVSKEILSLKLLVYLEDNSIYVDKDKDIIDFIVSVDYFLNILNTECDTEINKEVAKIINQITPNIDPKFDGLAAYDYIQFI